jgi:hypothetical protein
MVYIQKESTFHLAPRLRGGTMQDIASTRPFSRTRLGCDTNHACNRSMLVGVLLYPQAKKGGRAGLNTRFGDLRGTFFYSARDYRPSISTGQ